MSKSKTLNSLIQIVIAVIVAIFIVAVIQQVLFLPVGVQGPSMEPTISSSGYTAYVQKTGYDLEVNDIIVFYRPLNVAAYDMVNPAQKEFNLKTFFTNFLHLKNSENVDYSSSPTEDADFICVIKRIIGVPGDTIEIKDEVLYRNEVAVDDFSMVGIGDRAAEVVGEGQYFVLGDNRGSSYDSEDYGPIEGEWILGKVIMLISRGDGFGIRLL